MTGRLGLGFEFELGFDLGLGLQLRLGLALALGFKLEFRIRDSVGWFGSADHVISVITVHLCFSKSI